MHRALLIHEILSNICRHSNARDLFHLALACKAFSDPALDILWMFPMTTSEVFRPFVAWEVLFRKPARNYASRPVRNRFTLIQNPERPATLEDLRRFRRYSTLVQMLTWDSKRSEVLPYETITTLKHLSRLDNSSSTTTPPPLLSQFLFPNITKLHVLITEQSQFQVAQDLFLAPSLAQLHIIDTGLDGETANFLRRAPWGIIANLRDVSISLSPHDQHPTELVNSIMTLLNASPNLERFEAAVSRNALRRVLTSPFEHLNLLELTLLSSDGAENPDLQEAQPFPIQCPSLTSVTLELPYDGFRIEDVFPAEFFSRKRRVRIHTQAILNGDAMVLPFLNGLVMNGSSGLEVITLRSTHVRPLIQQQMEQVRLSFHHLSPLMTRPLAGLKNINIGGHLHLDITNEQLLEIGYANPGLVKLHIGPELEASSHQLHSTPYPEPRINLEGLISFARLVPSLLELRLSVQAIPEGVFVVEEEGEIPRLRKWDVCTSTIVNPEGVAAILLTHLPNLRAVTMPPLFKNVDQELRSALFFNPGDLTLLAFKERMDGFGTVRDILKRARRAETS